MRTYGRLAGGRACEGLSASNLKALLLAIVAREGGFEIALDIFYMRLLAKRTDGRPIEEVLRGARNAGKELGGVAELMTSLAQAARS